MGSRNESVKTFLKYEGTTTTQRSETKFGKWRQKNQNQQIDLSKLLNLL